MHLAAARTRIGIKTILVPTDFSSYSELALRTARSLAVRNRAKVYVAHVLDPRILPLTSPEAAVNQRDAVTEQAAAKLRHIDREGTLDAVEHEAVLCEGAVWEQLSRLIHDKHVDVVVTGTHGPGGFSKLALGSVAEQIFRNAPCPVVTVGPLISSECSNDADLRVVLYPTDFSLQSLAAAEYAVALAAEHGAKLVMLHIADAGTPSKDRAKVRASAREKLEHLIPAGTELWTEPDFEVEFGDPVTSILEAASSVRANMIVLGVRASSGAGTHFPWAIASQIVRSAPCPVLTLRSAGQP